MSILLMGQLWMVTTFAEESRTEHLLCDSSQIYSYESMERDIQTLSETYPQWVRVDSLGNTADGRKLYHLLIGAEDAEHHVLVFASIHGREYITTPLVMKQTADLLEMAASGIGEYKGMSYEQLLKHTAVHVIPMMNPDGVSISQFGLAGVRTQAVRQQIYQIYELDQAVELEPYLRKWKSNAEGIDINRNFDADWERYDDHLGHPSSDHYKGQSIACTAEANALVALTEKYRLDRTISYHVQGEVIYWYFGQGGEILTASENFARAISQVTGYPLDADYESLDPAGYKDWALQKMGIPSLTIEVGKGEVPLDRGQLPDIYEKNKYVLPETLYSVETEVS